MEVGETNPLPPLCPLLTLNLFFFLQADDFLGRLELFSKCDELNIALKSPLVRMAEEDAWFTQEVARQLQATLKTVKVALGCWESYHTVVSGARERDRDRDKDGTEREIESEREKDERERDNERDKEEREKMRERLWKRDNDKGEGRATGPTDRPEEHQHAS